MSSKDCSSVYHKLIRKNYVELTETLELRDTMVIERLYSKGVLNKREKQVLQACTYNFERAEKLLDTFENRSQTQIEELIKTLIETRQDHIVKEYLTPTGSNCKTKRNNTINGIEPSMNGHQQYCTEWPTRLPLYDPYEQKELHSAARGEENGCMNGRTHGGNQSIFSALRGERRKRYTIAGKAVKKTDVVSYQGDTGVSIFFFTVTICDTTGIADIRVYDTSKYTLVKPAKSYIFENLIRKAEVFVATDQSNVCRIPSVIVPEEIERNAVREYPHVMEENTRRSLNMAVEALNSSHVRGKILKISPVKYVKGRELPVRQLALIDEANMTPVKVSIFADDTNKDYTMGKCVDISYVYRRKGDASERSLGTITESLITVITDFSECPVLKNIESSASIEDPDFEEQKIVDMKIYAIDSAAVFDCCTKRGCYNRKLNEDGLCPICRGCSTSGRSCWVKVKVEHEDTTSYHLLFKSDLDKFFKLKELGCYSDEEALIDDICDQFPISGKACFHGDDMTIITVKRKEEQIE